MTPAPAVALVGGSMTMKLPVVRLVAVVVHQQRLGAAERHAADLVEVSVDAVSSRRRPFMSRRYCSDSTVARTVRVVCFSR